MAEKVNKTEEQAQGAAPAAPEANVEEVAKQTEIQEQAQGAAPSAPEANVEEVAKPSKFIVLKAFRDREDWDKEYSEGADVSGFDENRLDHLVKIGYVTCVVE